MSRRPILYITLALGTGLAFWLPGLFREPPEQAAAVPPPAAVPHPAAPRPPPAPVSGPVVITVLPIATDAATALASPDATAEEDLATVELLLQEYAKAHQGNPVGENEEIVAALRGKNPRGLAYLPQGGSFVNASGQLVDRWGTPYFFHQSSARETEILSAGPDRQFHTADDLSR